MSINTMCFSARRFIESGIDIPSVNTIIVYGSGLNSAFLSYIS